MALFWMMLSCQSGTDAVWDAPASDTGASPILAAPFAGEALPPLALARRISLDLRGTSPSLDEVQAVQAGVQAGLEDPVADLAIVVLENLVGIAAEDLVTMVLQNLVGIKK